MLQERTNVQTLHIVHGLVTEPPGGAARRYPRQCCQLPVPQSRLKGFEDSAFSIAAPRLWNALPRSITDCKSVVAFIESLKLH